MSPTDTRGRWETTPCVAGGRSRVVRRRPRAVGGRCEDGKRDDRVVPAFRNDTVFVSAALLDFTSDGAPRRIGGPQFGDVC